MPARRNGMDASHSPRSGGRGGGGGGCRLAERHQNAQTEEGGSAVTRVSWFGRSRRPSLRSERVYLALGHLRAVNPLRGSFACAEHDRQLGGASPLSSLMAVKD